MYPFLSLPKSAHEFKIGTSFNQILRLYRFDKKLRLLLFNEIEKIEIAVREAVINLTADSTKDIFWLTTPTHFRDQHVFDNSMTLLKKEYEKSTEDFVEHFKQIYIEPYPPAWILGELLPMGNVNIYYRNLKDKTLKKTIAKRFYLHAPVFESWLSVLTLTRNACCHHSRVWNKVNKIIPNDMRGMTRPWITLPSDKRRIYYNICIIKYFLDIISSNNDFQEKLRSLFDCFPEIDLAAMGFPKEWKMEPIWKSSLENKCANFS
jgi:abortive infection bacteriophage resistance protein